MLRWFHALMPKEERFFELFASVFEQAVQRAPGCDDIGREIVHLHVAAIANDQALVAVEHARTLRHIVDRASHALIFEAQVAGK
jgi:hypothetical protein